MIPENLSSELANHLWQSTVVAAVAWTLAAALRKNQARTRYWIWLIASMKFLLPFSLLTSTGEWLKLLVAAPVVEKPALANVMEQIVQPFPQTQLFEATERVVSAHRTNYLPVLLVSIWICGALIVVLRCARGWIRIHAAVRAASPLGLAAAVPVLSSPALIEPGIFGIFRPVLLLPEGILERLAPEQLKAIVAHEMCHVRWRDNLTFALPMIVEALFWFHPAVWWIGVRLVEERERACDEAVLEAGNGAQVYAEGILNVCKFYVESPLECVAGVSGSDLKKRVLRIMSHRSGVALDFGRRALLMAAAVLVLTLPIGFGVVRGQSATANSGTPKSKNAHKVPQFDVVSIKPTPSSDDKTLIQQFPDNTSFHGAPVRMILRTAFGVEDDRIIGAPSWLNTNRYDIEAKVAPEDASKLDKLKAGDRNAMLIPLLTERFNLKYHHETRDLSTYALVVAKGGPRLTKGEPYPPPGQEGVVKDRDHPEDPTKDHYRILAMPGHIEADSVPMHLLADPLTQYLGRTVVDETGLTGNYNFTLRWTPDNGLPPMLGAAGALGTPVDADGAGETAHVSLLTAIQEQLGLKLETQKSSVDVIVIDHIDLPSAN